GAQPVAARELDVLEPFPQPEIARHAALERQLAESDRTHQVDRPAVVAPFADRLRLEAHLQAVALRELARADPLAPPAVGELDAEVEAGEGMLGHAQASSTASPAGPAVTSRTVKKLSAAAGATRSSTTSRPRSADASGFTVASQTTRKASSAAPPA